MQIFRCRRAVRLVCPGLQAGSAAVLSLSLCAPRPPPWPAAAEKERDAPLMAILDRVVGLGWDKGWTPKLSQR